MAASMKDLAHKKQLQDMAATWEMLATERRKQLAKQANSSSTLQE